MGGWKIGARLGAVVVMACAAQAASAQGMYRCSSGGSTYYSDRPCGTGAATGKLGSVGPDARRELPPTSTYIPPVGKAPTHLSYLSPECASLNDAIRTAPARGLKYNVISDLHQEYQEKCGEEDQMARRRVWQDKRDQREERLSQQAAEQRERTQQATSREQCNELLRILHGKRQQMASMTAGEKDDLQRFEASYNARCKAP